MQKIINFYQLNEISTKRKEQVISFDRPWEEKDWAIWIRHIKYPWNIWKLYRFKVFPAWSWASQDYKMLESKTKEEMIEKIKKEMIKLWFKEKKNKLIETIYTDKIKDLNIEDLDNILSNPEEHWLTYPEKLKVQKQKWKLEKKENLEKVKGNIKIWDIFVYSWGYEQTNIDCYQVISQKGTILELREIWKEIIETTWPFSDRVKPKPNSFIKDWEVIRKRLNSSWWISLNHWNWYLWDWKDTYHRSWWY